LGSLSNEFDYRAGRVNLVGRVNLDLLELFLIVWRRAVGSASGMALNKIICHQHDYTDHGIVTMNTISTK